MTDIKKSDKWMGRLGMLQSLIVIFAAYMLTGMLIGMQEDLNQIAEESCADTLFGCTVEEEEKIEGFIDFMQEKVVLWQAAWAFGIIAGIYFFYASFRLSTGPDHWVPLRGVVSSKVPALNLSDRQFFIYTTVAVSLLLFGIGYFEADVLNDLYDELNDAFEADLDEDYESSPTTTNGFVMGYCNTAFLFLILIIAYFGRDKPETEDSEAKPDELLSTVTGEEQEGNLATTDENVDKPDEEG